MVTCVTMTYPEEVVGIARACAEVGLKLIAGFTVETDGRLPCGMSLGEAITKVDEAVGGSVEYYKVNCAHPEHFLPMLR